MEEGAYSLEGPEKRIVRIVLVRSPSHWAHKTQQSCSYECPECEYESHHRATIENDRFEVIYTCEYCSGEVKEMIKLYPFKAEQCKYIEGIKRRFGENTEKGMT